MRIKVLSFAYARNRQGADLSALLAERGHLVTLYELDQKTAAAETHSSFRRVTIPSEVFLLDKAARAVPFVLGAYRRVMFCLYAFSGGCDVVVAINYPVLCVAALIAQLKLAKLVYYPLELAPGAKMQQRELRLCDRFCDMILGVEENRLAMLTGKLAEQIPNFVVLNAPRKGIPVEPRGKLVEYLHLQHAQNPAPKLVLYHGVYHKHSCLEELIKWTPDWPKGVWLILMIAGEIPAAVDALVLEYGERVKVVPPVQHDELFAWVRDATLGLLPYEEVDSLNVNYCSPQKMFDLLACGVPFIGSKRPLIEEVAEQTKAGICIDMANGSEVARSVASLVSRPETLEDLSKNARMAYELHYNYDSLVEPALRCLESTGKSAEYGR